MGAPDREIIPNNKLGGASGENGEVHTREIVGWGENPRPGPKHPPQGPLNE